ncbi:GAF and ANTAR domain-containing protein [Actinophytocola oryzae]|uniref:ANTAR domain-containing protein n=1 Tax=Actinophytocola oryzae TaxID=502181 RepID=A0A4R7VUN8_9PSEU|nr:GAF and ANTAR domain-containing protein [Actinophytocola oryzae]TDV53690.1 ANTAR domain-containing protein [Actinophytocola oryzae]
MPNDILTVASELAEITRLVEADDFGSSTAQFVNRIVATIPGCDDALITVRSTAGVETVHSSGDLGFDPLTPGPIVEAVTFREPRLLGDVVSDQRWPSFATQLVNAGYLSCLTLPLSTRGDESAVLTLLSRQADQFGESSYDIVLLLTVHAGVAFDNASIYHDHVALVAQLRTALRTRSLVGRAQGLVMRERGYDSDTAFELLKRLSQNNNVKLRDLAAQIVDAHENGSFEALVKELT